MRVIAITGGSGFVGRRLASSLLDDRGLAGTIEEIRLLDIRKPSSIPFAPSDPRAKQYANIDHQPRIKFVECDLTNAVSVNKALEGVDTVFHLASYGMSGREMLNVDQIRRVNLGGTTHIIDACAKHGIARLLYCSTYNVVFGVNEIINGNEDQVPYYPLEAFHDEYSKTKRIAEELVLKANRKELSTCAIRPAAIYGDGEERHLPRILNHVRMGLGLAGIGSSSTLCDWLFVDNLNHALILAASSLALRGSTSPAAGNVYCISDDAPSNNFEFLRPLCEGLGYPRVFQFWIPTPIMFYLAWMLEIMRTLLIAVTLGYLSFQPFLTRSEVMKVGVTHYFSMAKARKDLAYEPIVKQPEAIQRCVQFYSQEFGTERVKQREMRKVKAAST